MTALKKLSELDYQHRRKQYPAVPDHAIQRRRFSDATSNALTQCVIRWLTLNGCWATRVSSAGRYITQKQIFIPGPTKKGTADVHAIVAGRHISIEIKIGRDKMSVHQESVKRDVERAGGQYWIIHNFDEFMGHWHSVATISPMKLNNFVSK